MQNKNTQDNQLICLFWLTVWEMLGHHQMAPLLWAYGSTLVVEQTCSPHSWNAKEKGKDWGPKPFKGTPAVTYASQQALQP